jgi:penicillin-binding protein 1A
MRRLLKIVTALGVIFLLAAGGAGVYLWYVWSSNLPYIGALEDYNPPTVTEIYGSEGEVIGRFWEERRVVVPLEGLPPHLIQAFISAEDGRFYVHDGVDLQSIFRAFVKNLQAGKIAQGGSTITQQVTRSLLLKDPSRTYERKAREAILALQIEKKFSKERILFLYLNQIYLGHGAYGVEAAARTYFGKPAADLSLAESAMLAGLPQAPSRYSAFRNFNRARNRQWYVLGRMASDGYMDLKEAQEVFAEPLTLNPEPENYFNRSPYFTEHVRRYLEAAYGREVLYREGLKVYTSVDLARQRMAVEALRKGLRDLDKREGYRGPLRRIPEEKMDGYLASAEKGFRLKPPEPGDIVESVVLAVDDEKRLVTVGMGGLEGALPVENMKWARAPDPDIHYYNAPPVKVPGRVLERGDVILVRILEDGEGPGGLTVALEQEPVVEGALLCIEPETGRVLAMVGGRDFDRSQFNRAVQARRQPGSAFKTVIYGVALENGMTPSSLVLDAPYVASMQKGDKLWRPENYKKEFSGRTLLRKGLIHSLNVVTVKILREVGVQEAIRYARLLGIESDLSPDLALALGSSGLSLMELTRAYACIANGGWLPTPHTILRVEDRHGNVLEENHPELTEAISPQTAFVLTDMLMGVVKEGTGWRVRALNRPAAGKTGTTNDLRDAWFIGFTPELATGVWVGYDDHVPMGRSETGSRAASPIWLDFMKQALDDVPVKDFPVPDGVVFAKIDAEEGLLAGPGSEKTVFQAYVEGTEPTEHVQPPERARSGQFGQFDMDFDR